VNTLALSELICFPLFGERGYLLSGTFALGLNVLDDSVRQLSNRPSIMIN
jgi:hypothetical protein